MLVVNCAQKIFPKIPIVFYNYQSTRWRRPRKPFWLGLAKSKMFVIPKSKVVDKEESDEYWRLQREYGTQMKSLLKFIQEDNPLRKEEVKEKSEGSVTHLHFLKEIEESMERNDLWNAQSAELREKRLKKSFEDHTNKVMKIMDSAEEKKTVLKVKVEEIVKQEMDKSNSFVTPENLDEAIENCLKNVVDYDFAIDVEGNKYVGN